MRPPRSLLGDSDEIVTLIEGAGATAADRRRVDRVVARAPAGRLPRAAPRGPAAVPVPRLGRVSGAAGRPHVAVPGGQGRRRAAQRQGAQGCRPRGDGYRDRARPPDALPAPLRRPAPPVGDRLARRGRGGDGDRDRAAHLDSPHERRQDDGPGPSSRTRSARLHDRVLQPAVAGEAARRSTRRSSSSGGSRSTGAPAR